MKWIKVNKVNPKPQITNYRDKRQMLADECGNQCIYCAISESNFGGIANFHVEHYRPKSSYPQLENDYDNLFIACCICNCFKGKDFPNDPAENLSVPCYPNPSIVDYNTIFLASSDAGEIQGNCIASKYIVVRLYLNRPQLKQVRQISIIDERLGAIQKDLKSSIDELKKVGDTKSTELLHKALLAYIKLTELNQQRKDIPPYELVDTKRN